MRLHHLTVQAFGPFANRQEIDFDALSEPGLFLLHGPTGAGKTSVLDAVCFALYGQVPGARQKGGRLRSDHALPDVAPEVVCDFSLGPRRFEITRSPEWQRPKRRGEGTTREQTRVIVRERVGEDWVTLSTRADEAGDLVRQLIGMGPDQFTKLVLLPQGDFAAFLRATAEERRSILQRLFQTERFSAVEAWLAEHRRILRREVDLADARRGELLAKASQAASVLPLPAPEGSPGDLLAMLEAEAEVADLDEHSVTSLADVIALASRARTRLGAAQTRHVGARASLDVARLTLERTSSLAKQQKLVGELTAKQAQLVAATDQVALVQRRIDAAERVRALAPLVPELTEAGEALAAARTELAEAPIIEDPAAEAARLQRELDRIADALAEAKTLAEVETALVRADRELAAAETAAARAEGERAAAVDLVDKTRTQLSELAGRTELLGPAQEAVARAEAVLAAATERDVVEKRLRAESDELRQVVDLAQNARERWLDLRRRRLEGFAAELAAHLDADGPCPVCGSHEHPAPAEESQDHVSELDEEEARLAVERAAEQREALEQRDRSSRERLAALGSAAGDATVVEREEELRAARSHRDELVASVERARQLREELEQASASAEAAASAVTGSGEALGAVKESRAALVERREQLAARVSAARGDYSSVADRERSLRAAAAAVAGLIRATDAEREAAKAHARIRRTAAAAARAAGFDSLDEAVSATLDEATLDELRASVTGHAELLARTSGQLEEPGLAAAAALPPADLAAANAAERAAAGAEARLGADVALHEQASRELDALAGQLDAHEEQTAPLRSRYAVADDLTRCADGTGGDNQLRMRLSAYVLAARLEQVALAASLRLEAMSSGRYTLVHTDDLARGGARSGLGLRVVDGWTGQSRDPATLSGGETFYTSLALALGLADVVQAEAGGTAIETLLVDEGFGSLDDETLEDVMTVLDGLRAGGRTVGLVSHVADLRTRIPSQLEVRRTPSGSQLLQHALT